jgi:hypothetical protein
MVHDDDLNAFAREIVPNDTRQTPLQASGVISDGNYERHVRRHANILSAGGYECIPASSFNDQVIAHLDRAYARNCTIVKALPANVLEAQVCAWLHGDSRLG